LDGYQALLSVTQSARMMLPTPIAFKSAARVAQREAFQSGRTARLTKTLLSLAGARGGETPAVVAATTSEQKLRRRRRLWLRIALASLQRAGPGVVRAGVQAREGNGAPAPAARGCTKMTTTVSQRARTWEQVARLRQQQRCNVGHRRLGP
jgi:hypothetical protein